MLPCQESDFGKSTGQDPENLAAFVGARPPCRPYNGGMYLGPTRAQRYRDIGLIGPSRRLDMPRSFETSTLRLIEEEQGL